MTALIVAVKGGYTDSVKEILKRNPNVNLTDKDGNTALMIASKEGHTEIVQDLLDAGTYVNIPDRVSKLSYCLNTSVWSANVWVHCLMLLPPRGASVYCSAAAI